MRISPVTTAFHSGGGGLRNEKAGKIKPNNLNNRTQKPTLVQISFTGVPEKNVKQGVSISVEDSYIGLDMYKCGGAGSVADQMPNALNKMDGMDFRHVVPLYSYNNPNGQMKVLVIPKDVEYNPRNPAPENWFVTYPETTTKAQIAGWLNTDVDRIKFAVQDAPATPNEAMRKLYGLEGDYAGLRVSNFRELIPTDTRGVIQRIDENDLSKIKSIPYRVYRMVIPRSDGTLDDKSVYAIHTPDLAKFQKAYTYSPDLKDHPHVNLFTRDFGDAAADMLPKLNTPEVEIDVVHSATGAINETDVNLASVSNALILGFNVRANSNAVDLAKEKDIDIRYYSIIYNIVDDIKNILSGMLEPVKKEEIMGHAEVRQVFKITGVGKVAGSFVIDGEISRNDKVRLIRDGIVIYSGDLKALKRFKDDVKEVKSGYECGISIDNYDDIKEKDIIESFRITEEKRSL